MLRPLQLRVSRRWTQSFVFGSCNLRPCEPCPFCPRTYFHSTQLVSDKSTSQLGTPETPEQQKPRVTVIPHFRWGSRDSLVPPSGSCLTPRPWEVTQADILSQFPQLDHATWKDFGQIFLLVTPSFAGWLDESQTFLQKVVQRLYGSFPEASDARPIIVVAAVVDRLPAPSNHYLNPDAFRTPYKNTFVKGYEGVGLLLGATKIPQEDDDDDDASPMLGNRTTRPEEAVDIGAKADEHPHLHTIGFRFSDGRGRPGHNLRRFMVILPLANTLFVNGLRSTMFRTTWTLSQDREFYTPSRRETMIHQWVEVVLPRPIHKISMPLVSLTKQRRVASSMGNIIREVEGENGEAIPASQELEAAVSDYMKDKQVSGGRTLVYALVSKPDTGTRISATGDFQTQDSQVDANRNHTKVIPEPGKGKASSMYVQSCMTKGSRLHKVVSGGGGWGQKRGLLSLEPHQQGPQQFDTSHAPDTEAEAVMPVLDTIAEEGGTVKFFAAYEPDIKDLEDLPPPPRIPSDNIWLRPKYRSRISRAFGVIPANENIEIPPPEAPKQGSRKWFFYPHHFGALSEQRIHLRARNFPVESVSTKTIRLRLQAEPNGARDGRLNTQLDIPYANVTFAGAAPKVYGKDGRKKSGVDDKVDGET